MTLINELVDIQNITTHIQTLIDAGHQSNAAGWIQQNIPSLSQSSTDNIRINWHLLQGLKFALLGQSSQAIQHFSQAAKELPSSRYPEPDNLFSRFFLQSQLQLPQETIPAIRQANIYLQSNLEALNQVDPILAHEIQVSPLPSDFLILDYWSGLHLLDHKTNRLLTLEPALIRQLPDYLERNEPITFSGIGSGQEIRYCLQHRTRFIHGMTNAHYVFENSPAQIRLLMSLDDFSHAIQNHILIFFGGGNRRQRITETFQSLRYPGPYLILGPRDAIMPEVSNIWQWYKPDDLKTRTRDYYRSPIFQQRLRDIAAGKILPRIMVETSRWTTFLKWSAIDFQKAFEQLGCQTRFLIEQTDTERLSATLRFREMDTFKPDAWFMITHARPSLNDQIPPELPFISYLQDRCGALWTTDETDLNQLASSHDLFICLVSEFAEYLKSKKIRPEQMFILPVPADETMFFPLQPDDPQAQRFDCDVSYVKHGNADTDAIYRDWLQQKELYNPTPNLIPLANFYHNLYQAMKADLARRWPEDELHDLIENAFGHYLNPSQNNALHQMMTSFSKCVYVACRRKYYLQGLLDIDINLKLYGHGWSEDKQFKHCAGGPIDRSRELNGVYNFTRINLHMQPNGSMHPRVVECALAGGFMMIADIPAEKDWSPVRRYFREGSEIILYETREDLTDKCRYFLEHPSERIEISRRFHQRALQNHTIQTAARQTLQCWLALLNK